VGLSQNQSSGRSLETIRFATYIFVSRSTATYDVVWRRQSNNEERSRAPVFATAMSDISRFMRSLLTATNASEAVHLLAAGH
jgi:hypothetical protein